MNHLCLISRNLFSSSSTEIPRPTRSSMPWTSMGRCGEMVTHPRATVGSRSRGQPSGNVAKRIRPASSAITLIGKLTKG
jgi:hypothetical protein